MEAWNHTSQILALIANIHRDRKKQNKPYKPSDFHPVTQDAKKRLPKIQTDISVLKCFVKDPPP